MSDEFAEFSQHIRPRKQPQSSQGAAPRKKSKPKRPAKATAALPDLSATRGHPEVLASGRRRRYGARVEIRGRQRHRHLRRRERVALRRPCPTRRTTCSSPMRKPRNAKARGYTRGTQALLRTNLIHAPAHAQTVAEDELILARAMRDRRPSCILGRSMKAISNRR